GTNLPVRALALQADGQVLVAGSFTAIGGGTGTATRYGIGRLTASGAVDPSFDPGANDSIDALALQSDGKALVGGAFTALGGTGTIARAHLGRVNTDGSLDAAFDPGANDSVWTVAVQTDGKILIGGAFTMLGGGGTGTTPRSRIGRLHPD